MKAPDIDPDELLDCVLAHKAEFTRVFLKEHGLAKSGTKGELRERLAEFLEGGDGRVIELAAHLDGIEGWGNQHAFLYKAPAALCREWRKEDHVLSVLKANRCANRLNNHHPVLLPDKRTLSKVEWNADHVLLLWTEKRSWEERDHEQDEEADDGRVLWKAYVKKTARATLSFDWDLVSGHAMVLIRQLHRGTDYAAALAEFAESLRPFVELNRLTPVRLNKAIVAVREGGEVRGRLRRFDTARGGSVSLRSPSRSTDIRDDPDLARAESSFSRSANNYGNFYWLKDKANGSLERDVRTTMHAADHRIGVYGEWPEAEVRYVIGRIRFYCEQAG